MPGLSDAARIYVRLPNWVGDVVLATPFLRALRGAAPGAELIAHGKRRNFDVLAGDRLYDRAEAVERRGGPLWPVLEGLRLRRALGPIDLAFVLPNSLSSAIVTRATGARERLGYALNGRSPLLTRALPVRKEGRLRPVPMVDYYLGLLAAAGAATDGIVRRPVLTITPAQEAAATAFLERVGVRPGERVWALNIGGSWETKRWVPAHAGALVRLLRAEGVTPLLLRGPDEGELAREVVAAAGQPVPGAEEVAGLAELSAVLRRCELMITTDSGPRHFGVAAGIPVLVLIGSTHPGYTHVDYPALRLLCEEVDCWPCHLRRCPIDFRCMQRLTAEKVLEAARGLLGDTGREAA